MRFYANNSVVRRKPVDLSAFPALFSECRSRNSGEILVAFANKVPAAMAFLVWGHGVMYYNMATRSLANSTGAMNLLLWVAIKSANERAYVFDFDGVVKMGAMRFFLGFGGQMKTRLLVTRSRASYKLLRGAKTMILGGQADESGKFT
jgi:hypothetical protein